MESTSELRRRFNVAAAVSIIATLGGVAAAQQSLTAAQQSSTAIPSFAGGSRDFAQQMEDALRAAKTAAGVEHLGTLNTLCVLPPRNGPLEMADAAAPRTPLYRGDPNAPPQVTWYAEATRVFDDLYWLGSRVLSAWLLTSDEGHILIDTVNDFNSEELILDGMRKFGLDPTDIKYIVITHAHRGHIGGVEVVQRATNNQAIVVMASEEWKSVDNRPNANFGWTPNPAPNLRMSVPAEGTLDIRAGPNTVRIHSTPGHTPGTISLLFDVHDWGRALTVAYSGGTAFGFQTDRPDPGIANLERYRQSQMQFQRIAAEMGATVLLSNHSEYDSAQAKARMMAGRTYGVQHPFEIGAESVRRYFDVMINCATLKTLGLEQTAATQ